MLECAEELRAENLKGDKMLDRIKKMMGMGMGMKVKSRKNKRKSKSK